MVEIKESPSEDEKDPYLVTLEPEDNPQNMSAPRRWVAVLVISSASLCVTCASSVVSKIVSRLSDQAYVGTIDRLPLQSRVLLYPSTYRVK